MISRMEKSMAGGAGGAGPVYQIGADVPLEELANKGGCSPADIDTLVLTGNTAMLYFLPEGILPPFPMRPLPRTGWPGNG